MRFAKTPLPRFFAWWGGELLACLPARWRAVLSERSESLLLHLDGDSIVVWREKGGTEREYARIRRDLPADEQAAEFRRLRGAIDDPAVRTVFLIPAERVLTRMLSLPAAAEDNLRQVLGFEMDRQTPFKAEQVYFDSRVLGRDASGRNAQVELVLIPRAQLDQELAALPAGAAELDGVDSWRGTPGEGRRGTNLLPPERRAHRRNLRLPLNLGLAALALILLVVNMNQSLANRAIAVEQMRIEVEQANVEAKRVAALRKTLADSIDGANFLTERKRKGPLMVGLINDLTERVPEDTYLERLQIENNQVQLQGQAEDASRLIGLLGESSCLGNPGFQGQVQPDARTGKDRFQINADLKECSPLAATRPSAVPARPVEGKDEAGRNAADGEASAGKPADGKSTDEKAANAKAPKEKAASSGGKDAGKGAGKEAKPAAAAKPATDQVPAKRPASDPRAASANNRLQQKPSADPPARTRVQNKAAEVKRGDE